MTKLKFYDIFGTIPLAALFMGPVMYFNGTKVMWLLLTIQLLFLIFQLTCCVLWRWEYRKPEREAAKAALKEIDKLLSIKPGE